MRVELEAAACRTRAPSTAATDLIEGSQRWRDGLCALLKCTVWAYDQVRCSACVTRSVRRDACQ